MGPGGVPVQAVGGGGEVPRAWWCPHSGRWWGQSAKEDRSIRLVATNLFSKEDYLLIVIGGKLECYFD